MQGCSRVMGLTKRTGESPIVIVVCVLNQRTHLGFNTYMVSCNSTNELRHVLKHVKRNQQCNKTCVRSDSVFNYLSECAFFQILNIFETISEKVMILGVIVTVRIL